MGGGLMQLVAYGAQDIYLTGNPQITFFKVVYRRHTNFSMESIMQTFSGTVSTGGSTVTSTISRNGDLVSNLWLDMKLDGTGLTDETGSEYMNWTNNTGHALVKECEIEIGGQLIDRHYSQWLDVWNELTDHDESEWRGLNKHAAHKAYLRSAFLTDGDGGPLQLYVPLKFWFCRNPGLALPLIALQYHEVKVRVTFRNANACVNRNKGAVTGTVNGITASTQDYNLWADYIYLDTDERRRFAQVSHEYLIEQVQKNSTSSEAASIKLNFNHPIKELIWVIQDDHATQEEVTLTVGGVKDTDASINTQNSNGGGNSDGVNHNDYFNYRVLGVKSATIPTIETINGQSSYEHFSTGKLQLNGNDRFAERNASYFRTCQPVQAGHKVPSKHIYCYSFALKPEEHQPSGTCNFSRIDTASLILKKRYLENNETCTVWAINYNVLRIMSGMGGLAYSN